MDVDAAPAAAASPEAVAEAAKRLAAAAIANVLRGREDPAEPIAELFLSSEKEKMRKDANGAGDARLLLHRRRLGRPGVEITFQSQALPGTRGKKRRLRLRVRRLFFR